MRLSGSLSGLLHYLLALLTGLLASSAAVAPSPSPSGPAEGDEFEATIRPVDEEYRARMVGVTWQPGCPVPIDDLRIVEMSYLGFDGEVHHDGRLMVHRLVAEQVVDVFRELFEQRFPIRRMALVEEYGGDDDASMAADNTSAFSCRPITGTTDRYSTHSYGQAIDINPVENPYVKGDTVLPPAGAEFLDRTDVRPGMITESDAVVKAFRRARFTWGGGWTSLQDHQHFESRTLLLPD